MYMNLRDLIIRPDSANNGGPEMNKITKTTLQMMSNMLFVR